MEFKSETIYQSEGVVCRVICPDLSDCSVDSGIDSAEGMRSCFRQFAFLPVQTHSLNVGVIEITASAKDNPDVGNPEVDIPDREFPDTDALISFDSGVAIGIITADCVPLLLYAPDVRAVAAIHAGWRGTLGGIVDNVVEILKARGGDAEKMIAVFGPSISSSVYEVDNVLADKFADAGFGAYVSYPEGKENKPHIDLQGVNTGRLFNKGLRKRNVILSDKCTFTTSDSNGRHLYPSYRRNATPMRLLTSILMTKRD